MEAKCPKCGSESIQWIKANTFTGVCQNCHYQGMMKGNLGIKKM